MIDDTLRQRVRATYAFRCGYCGVTESEAAGELTVDHFQPQSRNGSDDFDNLVYSCYSCNGYKGAAWNPAVPPVLHPLRDDLTRHFAEQPDGTLQALTDAGQRHIDTLHLNRAQLILHRNDRRRFDSLLQRQGVLEERIDASDEEIRRMRRRSLRAKRRR